MSKNKYKYYAVHGHNVSGGDSITWYEEPLGVWYGVKALNEKNAVKQLEPKHKKFHEYNSFFVHGIVKGFETVEERSKYVEEMRKGECK